MEVLAPAGNKENLISAINGGANAVYLGLSDFSARKGADNFSYEELKFSISYAKLFNVKIYLTVNTIVKNQELKPFIQMIINAYNLGVDAFILQDVFLGKYLKSIIPDINLHLSTQAGVCNEYGAKMAKEYGFSRVILARETAFEDIKRISSIIETEVFIQGALCASLSGHCYFSSFIGGNSGNRGYCKQPCRKKCSYFDGKKQITNGYSLSLADLNLSTKLSELKQAGVSSLKIEGRMRSKEYVYSAVKYYRNLLDNIFDKNNEINLYKTYNRGDYTLGLAFNQDKNFISNKIQGHKGYFIDKIKLICNDELVLYNNVNVNVGDSYKIIRNGYEVGNAIAIKSNNKLSIKFKGDIKVNDSLYITKDTSLNIPTKRFYLGVDVYVKVGEKIKLKYNEIEITSNDIVEIAKTSPTTEQEIINNLSKTDIYPFKPIVNFKYFDENAFIPKSVFNKLRSEFYEKIFNIKNDIICDINVDNLDFSINNKSVFNKSNSVILSNEAKVVGVNNIIYSPSNYNIDPTKFIEFYKDKKVWLYLPPYMSNSDFSIVNEYIDKFYGVFIEGYWGLQYAKEHNLKVFVGTGLNIFNHIDVKFILKYSNVEEITLSKELSFNEITEFNNNFTILNASKLQIMDLIYCPFNKKCNTCPYTENVILKDEDGREFKVFRYKLSSCRFKIFNMSELYCEKLDNFSTLYDLTGENQDKIEEFFAKKTNKDKSKTLSKLTYGNYLKGIK